MKQKNLSKSIALALTTGIAASMFMGATVFADSPDGDLELKNQGGLKAQDAWTNIKYIETNGDNQMVAFLKGLTVQATKGDFLFQNPNAQGIRTRNNTKVVIEAKENIVMKGYLHSTHKGEVDFAAENGNITLLGQVNVPGQPIPAWISGSQMNVNAMKGSTTMDGVLLAKDNAYISVHSAQDNTFNKPLVNARSDGGAYVYIKSDKGNNTFNGFLYDNDVKNYDTMKGEHQFNSREFNGKETPIKASGAVNIIGNNNTFKNWQAENIGTQENPTQFYNKQDVPFGIRITEGAIANITATTGNNTVGGHIIVNPSVTLNMKAEGQNIINGEVMVSLEDSSMPATLEHVLSSNNEAAKNAEVIFDAQNGNIFKTNIQIGHEVENFSPPEISSNMTINSHQGKTLVEGVIYTYGENKSLVVNSDNKDADANKFNVVLSNTSSNITINANAGGNTIQKLAAHTQSTVLVNAGDKGNTVKTLINDGATLAKLNATGEGGNTVEKIEALVIGKTLLDAGKNGNNVETISLIGGGDVELKSATGDNNVTSISTNIEDGTSLSPLSKVSLTAKNNTVDSINLYTGTISLKATEGANTVEKEITASHGRNEAEDENTEEYADLKLTGKKNIIKGTIEASDLGFVYLGTTEGNELNDTVTMTSNGKVTVATKDGDNTIAKAVTVGAAGAADDKSAFVVTNETGNNTVNSTVTANGNGTVNITATAGTNLFSSALTAKDTSKMTITAGAGNNLNGEITADKGSITIKTTGEQGQNILAKEATVTITNAGTVSLTGSNGNEINGAVNNTSGTFNATANNGDNNFNSVITNTGGTVLATATTGNNNLKANVTTTGDKAQSTFTADAGNNVVDAGVIITNGAGSTTELKAKNENKLAGKLINKGTMTITGDSANTVDGTVTNDGSMTVTGGTNTINGEITSNAGSLGITASTGDNLLNSNLNTNGGTVTIAATEGSNKLAENVAITNKTGATTELTAKNENALKGNLVNNGTMTVTGETANTVDGTITNDGKMTVTGGTNTLNGEITNNAGGTTNLLGGSNNLAGSLENTGGAVNITANTGDNTIKALTSEGGTVNITATKGANNINGPVKAMNDANISITAEAKKNILSKDGKLEADEKGNIEVTGAKGNQLQGSIINNDATVKITATTGDNNLAGSMETNTGTTTITAAGGNNVITGSIVTANAGNTMLNATESNKFNNSATVTASAEGTITANGKNNTVAKDATLTATDNGTINLIGAEGNTIDGSIMATKSTDDSKPQVNITANTGANTVNGQLAVNGGTITVQAAQGKNIVNDQAKIEPTNDGTITFNGQNGNEINPDLKVEEGNVNIIATNGDNEIKGTADITSGSLSITNDQGNNKITGAVTISEGNLNISNATGNNDLANNLTITNGKLNLTTDQGTNTINGAVKADAGTEATIKGKNNELSDLTADFISKITVEASEGNTINGTVNANDGSQVVITAPTNNITGSLVSTGKHDEQVSKITVQGNLNLSNPGNNNPVIKAADAGTVDLNYQVANITGDFNALSNGEINILPADPQSSLELTGNGTASDGGTINLNLSSGSVLKGTLNNNDPLKPGEKPKPGDENHKGTINLTLQGANKFIDPITGEEKPIKENGKDVRPSDPTKNRNKGATWIPNNVDQNKPENRTFSSIDKLAGMGVIEGQNANITVGLLDNVENAPFPSRISFVTPVSVKDWNDGKGIAGKMAIKAATQPSGTDPVTKEPTPDAPKVTIVASDYEEAYNEAVEQKDLAIVFETHTPKWAIDHIVDYSLDVPAGLLEDPLVVERIRDEWRIVLNSQAQKSKFGDLVTKIAPLATYGTMVSNLFNDTYNQRMGAVLDHSQIKAGPWARSYVNSFGQGGNYRSNVAGLQAGYRVVKPVANGQIIHSVALQSDTHKVDFPTVSGNGKVHGTLLGYYYTDIKDSGSYWDINAKLGRLSSKFDVEGRHDTVHGAYHNNVLAAGVEHGYTKHFGHGSYVQPQVQLQFTHLAKTNYTAATATVALGHLNSLVGRAGINAGWKTSPSTDTYIRANVLHEFMAKQNITAADITTGGNPMTTSIRNRDTWYAIGLGVTHTMKDNSRVFADVEKIFGANYRDSYRVNFGAQFTY